MGQQTHPDDLGSRRAKVLTLVASALLLVAGFVMLHFADHVRLTQPTPLPTSVSTSATPTTANP
ncbi:hypothetical protein [Terrabacter sp. NPDC080008]|uniref:hypothetical protein n=1 Tax=Terrabacter sp. NPDC080008 TaxID=3155176 RepID=UPI00344D72FB